MNVPIDTCTLCVSAAVVVASVVRFFVSFCNRIHLVFVCDSLFFPSSGYNSDCNRIGKKRNEQNAIALAMRNRYTRIGSN